MREAIADYCGLITQFLDRDLDVASFRSAFLAKFKVEERQLTDDDFELLDTLFGDVDAFTSDSELLASNPSFYMNEETLRARSSQTLRDLLDN